MEAEVWNAAQVNSRREKWDGFKVDRCDVGIGIGEIDRLIG